MEKKMSLAPLCLKNEIQTLKPLTLLFLLNLQLAFCHSPVQALSFSPSKSNSGLQIQDEHFSPLLCSFVFLLPQYLVIPTLLSKPTSSSTFSIKPSLLPRPQ